MICMVIHTIKNIAFARAIGGNFLSVGNTERRHTTESLEGIH